MGKLADQLNADLKQAMLAGDKELVSTLKGAKTALQYAAVERGAGVELTDEEAVKVLQKESKKRSESAKIYQQAGDNERADKELAEKKALDSYLPELLGEEDVAKLVDEIISEQENPSMQQMGQIIAGVMKKAGGLADGGTVARLVKERLSR